MKNKVFLFIMILFLSFTVYAEGEATINNIKVNGTACTCTGYDCVVDVTGSSATITYDLVDKEAKVDRLSGFKVDLLSEATTIKLTVTNSTGEEKIENVYNLTINKATRENDLSLKSLTVNGETIKVANDIVAYSYNCEYDVKTIKIEVTPNDSSVKINKKDQYEFPLEDSTLAVDFSLEPAEGEKMDYRIMVTRNEKPDTTLKSLKVNDKEIKLKEKEFNYELKVEYSVNELEIKAVPNNKEAKVEIEDKTLVVGENEVKIIITSDKTKSEYVLKVTREENVDKSVANLSSLEVDEYRRLDFKENVLDYTLKFSSVPKKLTITTKPKDENAKVTITGNEELVDGSVVTVSVKLDNITREYTLTLKESKSITDNKNAILWCIIGLSITIIVLLFLEIHSKKQAKRNYLKKIFDLRHKVEKKRTEEKKGKIKNKAKEKKIDDDEIEII